MGVRLSHGGASRVVVLVMFVVPVEMVVFDRFMDVLVLIALGEMKLHADRHRPGRNE